MQNKRPVKNSAVPLDDSGRAYKSIGQSAGKDREGFPPLHNFPILFFNRGAAK
jgi:hypothetical protein